ncbi:hypothetical protein GLIP_1578 [Aliiglaciecola lipolytica E3]|uniref:BD-FAE-like domain-containing protein n=2 Tax=Aliiglaciecola TaxID=1406885 RepID=K6Y7M1_9ALTE|nr:hypothetical protein GLIP_1578 [Aliiglaciecola lipolytica E3]
MVVSLVATMFLAKVDAAETEFENVAYRQVLEAEFNVADKTLSYGTDKLQFGKLWLPAKQNTKENFPLVIFIHGGCWLNAFSIEHSYPLTSALAKNGAMVWSLEYRRTGDNGGGWPGTLEDIVLGIEYILKQQPQYGFDSKRIIIAGHSAGGHLALLAQQALDSQQQSNHQIQVIGLAAITDIIDYAEGSNSCQQAVVEFMGGSAVDEASAFADANPKDVNSAILLHGDKDQIVPLSQSTKTNAEVVVIQGAGHFDFLHPKTKAFSILNKYVQTRK